MLDRDDLDDPTMDDKKQNTGELLISYFCHYQLCEVGSDSAISDNLPHKSNDGHSMASSPLYILIKLDTS